MSAYAITKPQKVDKQRSLNNVYRALQPTLSHQYLHVVSADAWQYVGTSTWKFITVFLDSLVEYTYI